MKAGQKIGHRKTPAIPTTLIAPCGMNCRLCLGYVRERNRCPGCRLLEELNPKTRTRCRIGNCPEIASGRLKYCSERCAKFPCARLKQLDKRYRTRYGMSMIENLARISEFGIRRFIRDQKKKWACPGCGELLCVHRPVCLACGHRWR